MDESSQSVRILAFSDLHGGGFMEASALIDRHRPDWIVTCGDMLPDFQQRPPNSRLRAQQEYWRDHRDLFIREGAITTMIVGNHELPGFRFPGMNSLPPGFEDRVVKLERIPREFGPFSFVHGLPEDELAEDLQDQLRLRPEPHIYLSHAPPYGSCDRTGMGDHIGHRPLFHHLQDRDWPQALVLCGHVHRSFGTEEIGNTTIVNMATGYALIEWEQGDSQVLEMARMVEHGNFWDSP